MAPRIRSHSARSTKKIYRATRKTERFPCLTAMKNCFLSIHMAETPERAVIVYTVEPNRMITSTVLSTADPMMEETKLLHLGGESPQRKFLFSLV